MANNKVKFNLWNVYYAPLLTNTTSKIEYGTPIAIPRANYLSQLCRALLRKRADRFPRMSLGDTENALQTEKSALHTRLFSDLTGDQTVKLLLTTKKRKRSDLYSHFSLKV